MHDKYNQLIIYFTTLLYLLQPELLQLLVHDMNDVMKGISFVSGDSAQFHALLESGTVDYIAIYAWAKYLPKQSAHMMKGVADIAGKKKNILVLSLNLDYPAMWMSQDSLDKENSEMEIKFASN